MCIHELKLLLKQFIFSFLQIQGKQMTKWAFLLGVVRDVHTFLRMLWPHICSILLFLLFIVWNGSVALGDKRLTIRLLLLSVIKSMKNHHTYGLVAETESTLYSHTQMLRSNTTVLSVVLVLYPFCSSG